MTITNVAPFATIAGQGIPFPINVTTLNEGDEPATFNLTLYYNSTLIETKQITQPSGTNITTTFIWNTTELTLYQNYTISASTIHSTLSDGTITLAIPGDINADRTVDVFDAVLLSAAAGSQPGSLNWNPNADLNADKIVDVFDAVILSGHAGETLP